MAKKRYRCNKCRKVFLADRPACEKCGIDASKNPRLSAIIVPVVTMHFEPMSEHFGIGIGELACQPGRPIAAGLRFTGAPSVANCEQCRASAVWQREMELAEDPTIFPDADELIVPEPRQ
jgi:rubredoxin